MDKRKPTDGDWGWFAGLVDGDGCISIQRVKNRYYTASIIVVNKKPENILKLMTLFGGSVGSTARQTSSSYVNGTYYRWTIKAVDEVLLCLMRSVDHMAEKRDKANLAIELCELLKKQRALRTYKNREEAIAKMDLIYQACLSWSDSFNGNAAKQIHDERPARASVGQAIEKQ